MNNDISQGNLAGELISEMQKNNPPSVFNVNNDGDQLAGGQMGQMGQMGQPGQNNGQNNAQINPQLQQQFMFVLQQDPQLQQKFADPQILQQALQNTNVMMNTIAYFQQQTQSRQQSQSSTQALTQPQVKPPIIDDDDDDVEENSDDDKTQYEDKIEDIDLMVSKQSWMDKIINNAKMPLIMTVTFILLLQPFVRDYIVKLIPKVQDSVFLQTLILGGLFFITSFLSNMFLPIGH